MKQGMTRRQQLLQDYLFELVYALQMKLEGTRYVDPKVAGERIAAGRVQVPIDDYILWWEDGVNLLKDEETDVNLEELEY